MGTKILVVDDEPDLELLIRQKFRTQIKAEAFQFEFAQNGLQALEKLDEHRDISLVLTDINMPEMDGLTLLQRIGELNNPLLKAVIISAYGDMENIRTAMNRGAFDFLTKPIDFTDLDVTVQKTLRQCEVLRGALRAHDQLVVLQRDMLTASRIQQSLLPKTFPPFPSRNDIDLYAHMITAKEVGGDFYDFYFIDEDRLAFTVGDVSGKGIPAAIYMAVSRTLLKAIASQVVNPGEVLRKLNALLIPESEEATYVTVFYGVLNTRTGEIQYSSGGHPQPFVVRAGCAVEQVPLPDGSILGKIPHLDFETKKVVLKPGEGLYIYTDGVSEAMNPDGDMYLEQALETILRTVGGGSAQQTLEGVLEDVKRHTAGAPQSDDITLLGLRWLGKNGS